MTCEKCGTQLREGAKFCPECGVATEGTDRALLPEEYSYETHHPLFPRKVAIQTALISLPFVAIGLLVALTEGFWFVPLIMVGIVLLAVFIVTWSYKGKQEKWGVWRTLYIISPFGVASGFPPEVSKRLAAVGGTSAAVNLASRHNWAVISHGLNELDNVVPIVLGLPLWPWESFSKAEYRPEKREIALHIAATDRIILIETNPDNYATVEQLVRRYMGSR